jgi:hypothetical protein
LRIFLHFDWGWPIMVRVDLIYLLVLLKGLFSIPETNNYVIMLMICNVQFIVCSALNFAIVLLETCHVKFKITCVQYALVSCP